MHTKHYLFLMIFCMVFSSAFAAEDKTFATRIKGTGSITTSAATTDGGYVTASSVGSLRYVVMRMNKSGEKVWERALNFSSNSGDSVNLTAVAQVADKGFVFLGYIVYGYFSSLVVYDQAIVIKLRSDGSVSWKKLYGRNDRSMTFSSITPRSDGGFLASGTLFEGNPGTKISGLLVRFTSQGDVLWEKNLEFSDDIFPDPIYSATTIDNQSVIAIAVANGAVVIRVDDSGNIIWKNYLNVKGFKLRSIGPAQQNRFVLAGTCQRCQNISLIELNPDGSVHWKAKYSLTTLPIISISNVVQSTDNAYTLTGTIANRPQASGTAKQVHGFVFKITSSQDVIVQESFGLNGTQANSIFGTTDGGFLIFGAFGKDLLTLRMNSGGSVLECGNFVHPFRSKKVEFGDLHVSGIVINESRSDLNVTDLNLTSSESNHRTLNVCEEIH